MYDVGFLKNIFIVLVTHATEIYSASYALENYLKKVGSSFLVIALPFTSLHLDTRFPGIMLEGEL